MKSKKMKVVAGICAASLIVVTGCASTGQSAGLGALLGAGAGAALGGSGDRAEGAIIGALVGAAAGAIIHDVRKRSRQVADKDATYEKHDEWEPAQGFQLKMEDATVSPSTAQPGDEVTARMRYAALGVPEEQVAVSEKYTMVTPDGKSVELKDGSEMRTEGTWESDVSFRVTDKTMPGSYKIYQSVAADEQRLESVENLSVTEETALLTISIGEDGMVVASR